MTAAATPSLHDAGSSSNGERALHDLFAQTDEQILEIEPDGALVAPASSRLAREVAPVARATSDATGSAEDSEDNVTIEFSRSASNNSQSATHHSPIISHDPGTPPQWLAERMADPQSGAEARELWNGVQRSRQEAAAFREVFAKPEDARAAAERSRLLDDIDHAYFTGDSSQRAQLAATMLREDPAAFREMVFAGLRALEETGQPGSASNFAQRSPNAVGAGLVNAGPRSAPLDAAHAADSLVGAQVYPEAFSRRDAATQLGNTPANEAHLTAYATFERVANEDLERSVGSAIERTLDQALPHGNRAENAAMRGRLAATVRQEIEKALQGDRQLGEQVAQVLSARRLDSNARAQVVRLIGERAQQLVPGTAKRVLSDWTQTTLASHRGRSDRIATTAARRDVQAASTDPRAASAVHSSRPAQVQNRRQDAGATNAQRKVDYRRVSDEQILDS
jgi:hypothetical protein